MRDANAKSKPTPQRYIDGVPYDGRHGPIDDAHDSEYTKRAPVRMLPRDFVYVG